MTKKFNKIEICTDCKCTLTVMEGIELASKWYCESCVSKIKKNYECYKKK